MGESEGGDESRGRRGKVGRKEGRKEERSLRARRGGRVAGAEGGGRETVTAVTVVPSHTVWLWHARRPGHKGCTPSTKHDSLPLIRSI